jgi:hypothetical protein
VISETKDLTEQVASIVVRRNEVLRAVKEEEENERERRQRQRELDEVGYDGVGGSDGTVVSGSERSLKAREMVI